MHVKPSFGVCIDATTGLLVLREWYQYSSFRGWAKSLQGCPYLVPEMGGGAYQLIYVYTMNHVIVITKRIEGILKLLLKGFGQSSLAWA